MRRERRNVGDEVMRATFATDSRQAGTGDVVLFSRGEQSGSGRWGRGEKHTIHS